MDVAALPRPFRWRLVLAGHRRACAGFAGRRDAWEALGYGHPVAPATAWQIVSMRYMGPLACDGTRAIVGSGRRVASVPGGAGDGAAFSGGERVRMACAEG